MGEFHGQSVGSFEACSYAETVSRLEALEPDWKWENPAKRDGDHPFGLGRQPLQSTSILSASCDTALEAVVRHDTRRLNVIFVLSGKIEVRDRQMQDTLHIGANHVACVSDRVGRRLTFGPQSTWLSFQIPEAVLRQNFEEMTGRPYIQEFVLPPTSFCELDEKGLYQALRRAERDLATTRLQERSMLARIYEQLALIKLFTKLPNSLAYSFDRETARDAAPRHVLKAEAYMRENLHNSVSLEELANAAGCSTRVLQRLFRAYRNDTPLGILCTYRLSAAHGAIKAGKIGSITDLAMSLQFSNPGRFAVLYKNAYGYSPSSTLRFSREKRCEETA